MEEKFDYFSLRFGCYSEPLTLPLTDFAEEIRKAGFDLELEVNRREKLRERFGIEKGDLIWVSGVTDEVVEHAFEYSRKDLVRTPPPYEIIENRLFSSRFGAFVEELISPAERKGSVLRGFKKLQEKLLNASESDFIVWSSPSGPLGIGDLEYDYSWTYIFTRRGDRIFYTAVRTDFTLSEHAFFLNLFLSADSQIQIECFEPNSLKEIQKIVETPILIKSVMGIGSLKELGELMALTRANMGNIAYFDKSDGRIRYFDEIIDELSVLNQKRRDEREPIQSLIEFYEKKLLHSDLTREEQLYLLGEYVLRVNYSLKYRKNEEMFVSFNFVDYQNQRDDLIRTLQRIKGCAGGLRQNTTTFTSHVSERSEPFTCPKCGYTTSESVGNRCPWCGITKQQYIQELADKGKQACV